MRQDPVLLLLLGGSLAVNVYLGREVQSRPVPTPVPKPRVTGVVLPTLLGKTLDDRPFELSGGDDRELAVYVFSTQCSWCEKNLNNIRKMAGQMWTTYRFVGVSTGPTEGLQDYCRQRGINFEVILDVSEALQTAWGMNGTPQLLIVSRDGKLKKAFEGALDKEALKDAEKFFGLPLPGLEEAPSAPSKAGLVRGQCIDPWGALFDQGFSWPVSGVMQRCTESGWQRSGA